MRRLNMIITYPMDASRPAIRSDIKREHWEEVLSSFLQMRAAREKDAAEAEKRDVYQIHIQLDVADDDTFYCKHDCGNRQLCDGILLDVLGKISRGEVDEKV